MYPNTIEEILQSGIDKEASDVHLVNDRRPLFRIHGVMHPSGFPVIDGETIKVMINKLLNDLQQKKLQEMRDLDFSYSCVENYVFRFNAHYTRGNMAATIRITPTEISSVLRFALPDVIKKLAHKRQGLVVVAGTAGSGKSTTLTYMVDLINSERAAKVITIEDPIEYTHQSKKSLIVQREVGADTPSFADALKFALRQDPDVVVIGEMRDYESISMALTTVETGHLVITTVHAPDAVETIGRIIDVYPAGYHDQVCAQLAANLEAIVYQTLVPRNDGESRVLATEVLMSTTSIRNLIRRGAFTELRGQLDSEDSQDTHSLEACLSEMVRNGVIKQDTAEDYAKFPNLLDFSESQDFRRLTQVLKEEGVPVVIEKKDHVKILVLDDSSTDREAMIPAFLKQGYENILVSEKGKDSIDKVAKIQPHVVIVDMAFHEIDCFKMCENIKSLPNFSGKVVMVTRNLKSSDAVDTKAAGADAFVVKTASNDLLLRAIDNLLAKDQIDKKNNNDSQESV